MSEPVFDKQLIAIAQCQEALADFANFERWQILDYLSRRFGRYSYKFIDPEAGQEAPVVVVGGTITPSAPDASTPARRPRE